MADPNEPRWLDDEEQRTWRAYIQATRLLREQLDRELEHESGMPLSYYEILAMLSEAPDRSLRMNELAELLRYSRSRLSHAVTRLEEKGWVVRRPCETDRRGYFAELTDEGFTVLDRAAPGHVEGVRTHIFDQLSDDQIVQLRAISEDLRDHLAALETDGGEPVGG